MNEKNSKNEKEKQSSKSGNNPNVHSGYKASPTNYSNKLGMNSGLNNLGNGNLQNQILRGVKSDFNNMNFNSGNIDDDTSSLENSADSVKTKKKSNPNFNKKKKAPVFNSKNNIKKNLIKIFKVLPPSVKILILAIAGCSILLLFIILLIIFIVIQTTGNSEKLYGQLSTTNDRSEYYEDDRNMFASKDDTKLAKAEKAYYKKLEEVYDKYKRKYNVEIDTTLITATLFYGRTVADYGGTDRVDEIEDAEKIPNSSDPNYNDELMYEGDEVEFYKLAKRHVETLAKYQLLQVSVFNSCPGYGSQITIPENMKDVAENWTAVVPFNSMIDNENSSKRQMLYNVITKFNYIKKAEKTFTNVEKEQIKIEWCPYSDIDTMLREYFEDDKKIYLEKKSVYDNCKNSQMKTCTDACSGNDGCMKECTGNISNICSLELSDFNEVSKIFHENWNGIYDVDGNFYCVNTKKWGYASPYSDESKYLNVEFDDEIINHAEEPNFLEKNKEMVYDESKRINCSNEPAISYTYKIDISEEGVYYHKLMTETTSNMFGKKESFIERYYSELLDYTDEETKKKSMKSVVDEIFLLYETVLDREYQYCYTPGEDIDLTLNPNGQRDFINEILTLVQKAAKEQHILPSGVIAQAIVESGYGTSDLSKKANNYFGVMAPNSNDLEAGSEGDVLKCCEGNEFWNGDVIYMNNRWWRKYDYFSNSLYDHNLLLQGGNYNLEYVNDPDSYVNALISGGYTEDESYGTSLKNVIDDYNLVQYDIYDWDNETQVEKTPNLLSNGLGTLCFATKFERDQAINGTGNNLGSGTINGKVGNVRKKLEDTEEEEKFWGKDANNNRIANQKNGYGQCTWYALGRALEILTSNGVSMQDAVDRMAPVKGNGHEWYQANSENGSFKYDPTVPKPGSIVCYSNKRLDGKINPKHKYGHVAIIEAVDYDNNGNPIFVDVSEGGKGLSGFFRYTEKIQIKKEGNKIFLNYDNPVNGFIYLLD